MGWGCPACRAGGGGVRPPRRADHFDYTYVGEHFFVKKIFPGQNLCSGAFGGNICPYTKQRARHRSPFLERPPPPPLPGAHAIPPPQSNFRAALKRGPPTQSGRGCIGLTHTTGPQTSGRCPVRCRFSETHRQWVGAEPPGHSYPRATRDSPPGTRDSSPDPREERSPIDVPLPPPWGLESSGVDPPLCSSRACLHAAAGGGGVT